MDNITHIDKRDGSRVVFDPAKIEEAILKAGTATSQFDRSIAKTLTTDVLCSAQAIFTDQVPAVEQIQDLVEKTLMASPFKDAAKAYILYRQQHATNREIVHNARVDLTDSYLSQSNWQIRENSNMGFSCQGLNNYTAGENCKTYWLNKVYTPDICRLHTEGVLHIHDLSSLSVYCVGWDLYDLLISGFQGAPGKVQSAPAKHLSAVLGQIVNFFYTLQGEAAGAQAFSNFDTLVAPFIRYDDLSYRQVKQAIQEFVFNLNVPTRVGFQSPFTNLTLDIKPPSFLANQPIIIGGRMQDKTYGQFQCEMDMLNQAFGEVMAEGDAVGRPFTFPIPTYNITADFDWDNPHLEPLWKAVAKYGIPYFGNFVNSEQSPEDVRSMCCRLRLDKQQLKSRGGGLFAADPLTGSVGVVTVNMPRIGFEAKNENEFFEKLDSVLGVSKTSLETKRKVLEGFTNKGLYPYSKFYLRGIKEKTGCYWHNHFSTIGLVGMNEACLNLLGRDIGSSEGAAFAGRVLDHILERLHAFQQETGNLYNLEATPAEGACCRLAKLDQKHCPGILCANYDAVVTKGVSPFYTNSTQLPVSYTDDVFHALDLQDNLQVKYTGGTVFHVLLGEAAPDIDSLKAFIRQVCRIYRLPYFTITPTYSICPEHGYINGEHPVCPECGDPTEVYSRVVGYLRPVNQWNEGKQAEFDLRHPFTVKGS
ncbi:MAG: ribonucleoside triphosphate reductase [Planctomycetota bacterium]|nr:MAG: ribonucleoside triphosphate reductase [Planctomycetota bacterium]